MKNLREKIKLVVILTIATIICVVGILFAEYSWRYGNQVGVFGSFLLIICCANCLFSYLLMSNIGQVKTEQSTEPVNVRNKARTSYKSATLAMLVLFFGHIAMGVFLAIVQRQFEAISCLVLASIYFSCLLFIVIRIKIDKLTTMQET